MRHVDLITAILGWVEARAYLEVGVSKGETFFNVACAKRVGVDPRFGFDVAAARRAYPDALFVEATSDAFFGAEAARHGPFDVAFLDGLHTAEQITRDVLNAAEVLAPGGVIIVDDVLPNSW